ncbi:hypothetical protein M3Y97_00989300 [Aphelenchoides bicaudatus]|nr:hypothetical protein M3Y97_00989300 [Aphelenchoides bicaudatus]
MFRLLTVTLFLLGYLNVNSVETTTESFETELLANERTEQDDTTPANNFYNLHPSLSATRTCQRLHPRESNKKVCAAFIQCCTEICPATSFLYYDQHECRKTLEYPECRCGTGTLSNTVKAIGIMLGVILLLSVVIFCLCNRLRNNKEPELPQFVKNQRAIRSTTSTTK